VRIAGFGYSIVSGKNPYEMIFGKSVAFDQEGLPQVARKNTRRAATRGVEVRRQQLDDKLVAGIAEIMAAGSLR